MCTSIRFTDDKNNYYFGRNLDWTTGFNEKVIITPKNYLYPSAFLGELSPNYPVIGMAIIAENKPLYFDCANDSGLAIAGLNFPDYTQYEKAPIPEKTNLAAYEFPLWVAMHFKSIEELLPSLKDVAIVAQPVNASYPVSPLHWHIADTTKSIVIEYTSSGLNLYSNPTDVMTNAPTFPEHLTELQKSSSLPGDFSSSSRFIRASYLNSHYPQKSSEPENISRLFHTLSGVSVIDGAHKMPNGNFEKTIYTGGFSSATNTYYHNTYSDSSIIPVKLSDYNLDGSELITVE